MYTRRTVIFFSVSPYSASLFLHLLQTYHSNIDCIAHIRKKYDCFAVYKNSSKALWAQKVSWVPHFFQVKCFNGHNSVVIYNGVKWANVISVTCPKP